MGELCDSAATEDRTETRAGLGTDALAVPTLDRRCYKPCSSYNTGQVAYTQLAGQAASLCFPSCPLGPEWKTLSVSAASVVCAK